MWCSHGPRRVSEGQRERVVDAHRRKVTAGALDAQPKDLREQASGGILVAGPNDGVVECDCHGTPLTTGSIGRTNWIALHFFPSDNAVAFIAQPARSVSWPKRRSTSSKS